MTTEEAITTAYKMQAEWVGTSTLQPNQNFDLDRIHASMLQEHRWNRKHPARCTPAYASETHGQLILLGKVRKALVKL